MRPDEPHLDWTSASRLPVVFGGLVGYVVTVATSLESFASANSSRIPRVRAGSTLIPGVIVPARVIPLM